MEWFRVHQEYSVGAADMTGATNEIYGDAFTIRGDPIVDVNELVDRDEIGVLAWIDVALMAVPFGTQTADGIVRATGHLAVRPNIVVGDGTFEYQDAGGDTADAVDISTGGGTQEDDSQDQLHRTLSAVTGVNFSDGATGVGGSAPAMQDQYRAVWGMLGHQLDPRDEIFFSGFMEANNVDDSAMKMELKAELGIIPVSSR